MSDMDYEVAHGIAQIENAKLRAEIERLRATLEEIRDYPRSLTPTSWAREIARKALEGK